MNESETRAELIDPLLAAAGWGVVEGTKVHREHPITDGRIMGMGRRGRALSADFVLAYRGRKLAVLEAKTNVKGVTEGLAQAKNYAAMLGVRFAYSSNGKGLYRVDMSTGQEGDVEMRFPSPQELWDMVFGEANAQRDAFADVSWADKGTGWKLRYYQERAANAVLDAIAAGKSRLLLTLATGTGKTSIAAQIAWKLHQARWSLSKETKRQPRILFLADRNGLASQAYSDFSSFNVFEDRALVRITAKAMSAAGGTPPMNGAVFFTIFQTFMTGETEDAPGEFAFGQYPKDYFDLIIIDECHRGGANDQGTWRGILEYFSPAVQLGLTATPKREENADTYAYFGEPLMVYSLKQGINDGFLTPFKVLQVASSIDRVTIDQGDRVIQGEPEAGRVYGHGEFNRQIISRERDDFMVRKFMEIVNTDQKTLVFCRDQDHAARVRDLISQAKGSPHPDYCVRVTANDGEIGDTHLKHFQDNEKTLPTVLTTSQKLSTGVDARNVRNIVLMRPVNSMIEFKQIIGRGTRLFEGKDYFTIVDFVEAHHHFSDPEWDGDPVAPEPREPREPRVRDGEGDEGEEGEGDEARKRPEKIIVQLGPNKTREIKSYVVTRFVNAEGKVVTAAEFLKDLFGALPDFFHDEEELRRIWSQPETRKALLVKLADKGFPLEQLHNMQQVIDADNCDLFDVLAYVAFESRRVPREERSRWARRAISSDYGVRQRAFLEFVLEQYERVGVEELDQEKLPELIKLRYNDSIADGLQDLGGDPEAVSSMFAGFQRHLYNA